MPSDKPNILYVFSDQQRASAMGCYYGDEDLRTPNFDALAQQGMRLDTAVASTPVCTPYRAILMTGLLGHHTGVTTNKCFPDLSGHAHIGKTFKDAGYRCGYVGKWHLGEVRLDSGDPLRLGFDDEWFVPVTGGHNNPNRNYAISSQETVIGEGLDRAQAEASRAVEFIGKQDGEAPWCLFVSWIPPHPPLVSPDVYVESYLDRDLKKHPTTSKLADENKINKLNNNYAHYYGLTTGIDHEFGRIMQALEESGQVDNTIVIFTSDHGEMLGSQGLQAKRWPYREASQIPFIIRWPGKIDPGSSLGMPFGTLDVFPTLCGLAGLDVPEGLDGQDCSAAFVGGESIQDHVYLSMHHAFVPWPGWRGIRTERYNYARTEDGPWILFDVENDLFEEHNLVGENAELVAEMDTLLLKAMADCGDTWRGVDQKRGDWEGWLGPKQSSQGVGAVYPGSERFQGNDW